MSLLFGYKYNSTSKLVNTEQSVPVE